VPAAGVPWTTAEARNASSREAARSIELELEGLRAPIFARLFAPTRQSEREVGTRLVREIVGQNEA
jgi:hypothetical protein